MTTPTDDDRRAAIQFIEHACRNWQNLSFDTDDLNDFALALKRDRLASERRAYEKAAGVAGDFGDWAYVRRVDGEWLPGSPFDRGQQEAARKITAAIRALAGEGNQ